MHPQVESVPCIFSIQFLQLSLILGGPLLFWANAMWKLLQGDNKSWASTQVNLKLQRHLHHKGALRKIEWDDSWGVTIGEPVAAVARTPRTTDTASTSSAVAVHFKHLSQKEAADTSVWQSLTKTSVSRHRASQCFQSLKNHHDILCLSKKPGA